MNPQTAKLQTRVFKGNALEWQMALVDIAMLERSISPDHVICDICLLRPDQAETQQ